MWQRLFFQHHPCRVDADGLGAQVRLRSLIDIIVSQILFSEGSPIEPDEECDGWLSGLRPQSRIVIATTDVNIPRRLSLVFVASAQKAGKSNLIKIIFQVLVYIFLSWQVKEERAAEASCYSLDSHVVKESEILTYPPKSEYSRMGKTMDQRSNTLPSIVIAMTLLVPCVPPPVPRPPSVFCNMILRVPTKRLPDDNITASV